MDLGSRVVLLSFCILICMCVSFALIEILIFGIDSY